MPGGFSKTVAVRLWKILELVKKGKTRTQIMNLMSLKERNFNADIGRLRKMGIELKYSRKRNNYSIFWPENIVSLKFSPREFFYILYTINIISEENDELASVSQKLKLALSEESNPIYDCGPAYGIGQNITGNLADLLQKLKKAVSKKYKTVYFYKSAGKKGEIRIVHPYKLVHTPVSWYLVAYCEERKDFRNFKLARIKQLKVSRDHFNRREFDIEKYRGDAFWLRWDKNRINNPYHIKILFKGEAADSIKEYKFHKTQTTENSPNGTIVCWKLSYLGEFASWLLQWLGSFQIIECDELKKIVKNKMGKNNNE